MTNTETDAARRRQDEFERMLLVALLNQSVVTAIADKVMDAWHTSGKPMQLHKGDLTEAVRVSLVDLLTTKAVAS